MAQVVGSGRLAGRTALVTGGGSGIGLATVRRFVGEGARVVVGDLDGERLRAVDLEFRQSVRTVVCDVTDETQVAAMCRTGEEAFGPLHVAVANAGRGSYGLIVDTPVDEFRAVLDLCITAVMLTIKHAAPWMADGGSIITVASLNGTQPSAGMGAYCAAKAGVMMLTQVAAMELGALGIRVNCIAPGLIETPATGGFFAVAAIVEEFVDNTTLGRHGTPAEVADLALFLASDESRFISAATMAVDGGASTGRYPQLPGAFARMDAPS